MGTTSVAAIILAAGASTRFGSPKQLVDWHGRPLLRHVVMQALAAPVSEIVLVLGAHFQRIAPVVHGLPVTLTRNPYWEGGMSSSVGQGLRALRADVDAAIFLLADQPGATAHLITRIISAYEEGQAGIVAPMAAQRPGNPALFARDYFPELLQVQGDQGGRALLRRYRQRVRWLQVDERALADIDWPRDLDQLDA